MKIEITKLTSWKDVLNAARFTQRKEPLDKEPSYDFKRKIIKAEHSPLRCLMFNIDLYDIPSYVSTHLVRHVHCQPFVSTSRPDIDGNQLPREEQKKTDKVNVRLFLNAQEIIHISRVRLCSKAEKETRLIWFNVVMKLNEIGETLLCRACVPNCVYRCGLCPEFDSCGFNKTSAFNKAKQTYIEIFEGNNYDDKTP